MSKDKTQTTKQYTQEEIWELRRRDPKMTRLCHEKGFNCEYVVPYGFVPEAGCPVHD